MNSKLRLYVSGPSCVMKTSSLTIYKSVSPRLSVYFTDYAEDCAVDPVWKKKASDPMLDMAYTAMKVSVMHKPGVFDRGWFDNILYAWIFSSKSIEPKDLVFNDDLIQALYLVLYAAGERIDNLHCNVVFLLVFPNITKHEYIKEMLLDMKGRSNKIDNLNEWYIIRQVAAYKNFLSIFAKLPKDRAILVETILYETWEKNEMIDYTVKRIDNWVTNFYNMDWNYFYANYQRYIKTQIERVEPYITCIDFK